MTQRPRRRIDLDGIALHDADKSGGPAIAIFRHRTTEGLNLLIPESADFIVAWEHVESVNLDLKSGRVAVAFAADYVAKEHWLRGARVIEGGWTDRYELTPKSLGLAHSS